MKYYLVEVKKAFGIYPLKAQINMREKLAKWIFAKNIKILKELKGSDLKKEFATTVKYNIEAPKKKKAPGSIEDNKNTPNPDLIKEVIKKINAVETIEELNEFNSESPEYKEAIDAKRVELENIDANNNDNGNDDTNGTEGGENAGGDEKEGTDDTNTDGNDVKTTDGVDFEDMTTEELLQICNETYKMNKPANTGRPNLLASLKEITKK